MIIKGCDISHWQNDKGEIDYKKARANVDFMIVKCTQGTGFLDSGYRKNVLGFAKEGGLIAHYHFANGQSPEAEASYFLSKAMVYEGDIIALDWEIEAPNPVDWCKRWLDYVSSNLHGVKPLLYLNRKTIKAYDWTSIIQSGYGLWMANYNTAIDAPIPANPWPFVAIRQYSNAGSVSGIVGGVDLDVFYGSMDAFKKYGVHFPKPEPVTPPASNPDPVVPPQGVPEPTPSPLPPVTPPPLDNPMPIKRNWIQKLIHLLYVIIWDFSKR